MRFPRDDTIRLNSDLPPVPPASIEVGDAILVIGSRFACIVPLLWCLNAECIPCPVPSPSLELEGGGGGDMCLLACS
jgi:hypothetical protein